MQSVKILSDSTCDLSEELTERFNISIIPLHVILGDDIYSDGVDITPEEIFNWVEKTKKAPKTAAPSPDEIIRIFKEQLKQYKEIVCFSIAEGMSASYANMHLAAQEMGAEDRIHIIDSANLSTGIGLLAVEAAELAADGADGETIVEHVEKQKPLVRSSFVIDTLMYLYRGGRCNGVTALAGETLKLHPKISVVDGEMVVGKKYRGKIDRVTVDYAHDLEKDLMAAQPKRVFITSPKCSPAVKDTVQEYLKSLQHFEEICFTQAGSVVACHCGPGTLGVLFLA